MTISICIGIFFRFWKIDSRPGWDWDEPVYANIAGNIADHGSMLLKPQYGLGIEPWLFHPPFHFLAVGSWFKLVGIGITQARIWSASMAIVMLVILFFALRNIVNIKVATIATSLLLIDTWMVYASRVSSIENTLLVVVVLTIWIYWRALRSHSLYLFIASGVLLGASILYKFTGAYVLVAVLLCWIICGRTRILTKRHIQMLAVTLGVIAIYCIVMTIVYWDNGNNYFWADNLVQFNRTISFNGSRGSIDNAFDMVKPLVHQYSIFVGTLAIAITSVVLVIRKAILCVKQRSFAPVKTHPVLFSWVVASIVSFGSIGLKFPTYFQLLLVPMYVYVVVELYDMFNKHGAKKITRTVIAASGCILVVLSAFGFYWRFVTYDINSMQSIKQFASQNIPDDSVVLAEESVGTMIPQPYCNIYRASDCFDDVKYIITYESEQHPIPSNPSYEKLQANSTLIKEVTGFKETLKVWKVNN